MIKFLQKLKNGPGQNEEVVEQFNRIHHEDLAQKHYLDKSIIEKGFIEKTKREDEIKRQRDVAREQV